MWRFRFVTRSRGVPRSVKQQHAAVKERKRGYDERSHVRGECRDFEHGGGRVRGRFFAPGYQSLVGGTRWTLGQVVRKFCMPFTKRERFRKLNSGVSPVRSPTFPRRTESQGAGQSHSRSDSPVGKTL